MGKRQRIDDEQNLVATIGKRADRDAQGWSPADPRNIRVVILDPLTLWVTALEDLTSASGMHVVGTATDAAAALDLIEELQPNLLLCGIDTEEGDVDLTVVRAARRVEPGLKVIALSQRSDRATIQAAFAAGADVHALKSANPNDLVAAMRQTFKQSIFVSSNWNDEAPATVEADEGIQRLTRRELEILNLVADGHTNRAMAGMLWVTDQTIKFHLSNIYRKLSVSNRTEAARWAQTHGLLHGAPVGAPASKNVA